MVVVVAEAAVVYSRVAVLIGVKVVAGYFHFSTFWWRSNCTPCVESNFWPCSGVKKTSTTHHLSVSPSSSFLSRRTGCVRGNSVMNICDRVRQARLDGHASAVAVSGQYRFLYRGGAGDGDGGGGSGSGSGGGGGARSRSNSSDVQMLDGREVTDSVYGRSMSPIGSVVGDLSALYSPASPARLQQPPSSSFSPATPAYAPPSPSGSARTGDRSSQRPGQQQSRHHFTSRSPSNDSRGAAAAPRHIAGPLFGSFLSRKASPTRRPPPQPQQHGWKEAAVPARPRKEKSAEEKVLESAHDIFRVRGHRRGTCVRVLFYGCCGSCW